MKKIISIIFIVFLCFSCIKKTTENTNNSIQNESSINNIAQPYIARFGGAWYNLSGSIYIVNPKEENNCEIIHLTIDNNFKIIKDPEIGIVELIEEGRWENENVEVIHFSDRTVNVRDVLYAPIALPIDIYGSSATRDLRIRIPKIDDILAKKIYTVNNIEIISGKINEDLNEKLKNSRLIIFNNDKYIFEDLEYIDEVRYGEGDLIEVETFNENEIILFYWCHSDRSRYPGNYKIRIHYNIIQE